MTQGPHWDASHPLVLSMRCKGQIGEGPKVVAVFAAGAPSIGFGEAVECAARTSLDLQ